MNQVILSILKKSNFKQYYDIAIKVSRSDETKEILRAIEVLHEKTEYDLSIDDLLLGLKSCYQEKKANTLALVVESWKDCSYQSELVEHYLQNEQKKAWAYDVALKGLEVSEGNGDYDKFLELLNKHEDKQDVLSYDFVSHDLEQLKNNQVAKGGVAWRLETLNKLLGHLPKNTFGFLFARPDSGKTTLLASEVTYMAEQLTNPVLWIANEEDAANVKLRCFQAVFGVTQAELFGNMSKYKALYDKKIGNKIMISGDPQISNRRAIESACNTLKPGLVIIDVLDKIQGFKAERYDLMVGSVYKWARELAKEFDVPVIGVTQANGKAEGTKYLHMDHVADSQTSKTAEADWILGLGKDHGQEHIRYLHTSKDKLPMSEGKDPTMTHGYAEIIIRPEIARYEDQAS